MAKKFLTKKLVANDRLLVGCGWVTNGHWMIRTSHAGIETTGEAKAQFPKAEVLELTQKMLDAVLKLQMLKSLDPVEPTEWRYQWEDQPLIQLWQDPQRLRHDVWLNCDYTKALIGTGLFAWCRGNGEPVVFTRPGKDPKPPTSLDEIVVVVMPVEGPKKNPYDQNLAPVTP